jgi:acetyl-CoA acyltransferase
MGETAENVAKKYNISRADQDQFALSSQQKAAAAQESGRFADEIMPVLIEAKRGQITSVKDDEFLRPNTTLDTLAALRPAFSKEGTVTAGNSSGLNDGACALLLASEEYALRFGLKGRARVLGAAVSGVEPRYMGIGPVSAINKLLSKIDLKLEDFSVIELNEAFAAQSLACLRELGLKDDDQRVNPNGGAIALGHPLGMSGARLVQTCMHELEKNNGRYALCSMCVGVGQGMALAIERV